jgi:hypothetical protein
VAFLEWKAFKNDGYYNSYERITYRKLEIPNSTFSEAFREAVVKFCCVSGCKELLKLVGKCWEKL